MNEVLSIAFAGGLVGFSLAAILYFLQRILRSTLATRRRRRWLKANRIIRPGML